MFNRKVYDLDSYSVCLMKCRCKTGPIALYVGVKCVTTRNNLELYIDASESGKISNPFPSTTNWEGLLLHAFETTNRRYFAARIRDLDSILNVNIKFMVKNSNSQYICRVSFTEIPEGKCGTLLAKATQRATGPLNSVKLVNCGLSVLLLSYLDSDKVDAPTSLKGLTLAEHQPSPVELLLASRVVRDSTMLRKVELDLSYDCSAIRVVMGAAMRHPHIKRLSISNRLERILGTEGFFRQMTIPYGNTYFLEGGFRQSFYYWKWF